MAKKGGTQSGNPEPGGADAGSLSGKPGGDEGKSSKKKRLFLIIGILILLLILGGAGVLFWKWKAGKSHEAHSEEEAPPHAEVIVIEEDPALKNMVALAPFKIPLKDSMGEWVFRVTLSLEAESASVKEEIEKRQEELREALTPLFQARRPSGLQEMDSKIALKTELIMAVNAFLKSGKIKNLYFTEFFVI